MTYLNFTELNLSKKKFIFVTITSVFFFEINVESNSKAFKLDFMIFCLRLIVLFRNKKETSSRIINHKKIHNNLYLNLKERFPLYLSSR